MISVCFSVEYRTQEGLMATLINYLICIVADTPPDIMALPCIILGIPAHSQLHLVKGVCVECMRVHAYLSRVVLEEIREGPSLGRESLFWESYCPSQQQKHYLTIRADAASYAVQLTSLNEQQNWP